jgi:predicted metal-binding protein
VSEYLRASALASKLEDLRSLALKLGAEDARIVPAGAVVVRNWVRWKCKFGCGEYGRRLTCPPYSPTPEETRKVLGEYGVCLLVKFGRCVEAGYEGGVNVHEVMFQLERSAFLSGVYSAFALACGPCPYCEECNVKEGVCRHPERARPSMEACGIDVYATARNAGYELKVVTSYEEEPTFFGLLLLA